MQNYLRCFRGEALLTTNYLQNRNPTKIVTTNRMPYGLWFGRQPNLSYLKVFGCKTHVFIHKEKKKIGFRFS
jgi:hypothetical protein